MHVFEHFDPGKRARESFTMGHTVHLKGRQWYLKKEEREILSERERNKTSDS